MSTYLNQCGNTRGITGYIALVHARVTVSRSLDTKSGRTGLVVPVEDVPSLCLSIWPLTMSAKRRVN